MTPPATPTLADLRARADARQAPARQDDDALVICDGLVRIYRREGVEVVALQGLDLQVRRGELIAVVGASGSGKSTLLGILSGLDQPTAGSVTVAGRNLLTMTPAQRLDYRRSTVGFVFQQTGANLLPYLTAAENVALPLRATGVRARARRARAAELLSVLGLADHAGRRADQLSGGQQQRVAIAVALANDPELVLADEPTGELDSATAAEMYDAFARVNAELGVTVVIVTHDPAVAGTVDRTVAIRDGRTASEVLRGPASASAPRTVREYAVLDRAGRLQLPHELVAALGLHQRVRLELAGDHIRIWPAEEASSSSSSSPSSSPSPSSSSSSSSGAVDQPLPPSDGPDDDGEAHHGRHVKESDG